MNNYWRGTGKYQNFNRIITSEASSIRYKKSKGDASPVFTGVPILDCHYAMSRIYHDVYNNGWGWNEKQMESLLKSYIRPVMGERFGNLRRFYKDLNYLEDCFNKVIVKVYTSDIKITRTLNLITYNSKWYVSIGTSYLPDSAVIYNTRVGICTFSHVKKYMSLKDAEFFDTVRLR